MYNWFAFRGRRISSLVFLLVGLLTTLTACDSGGGGPAPEEDETIVSDETLVVDSSEASVQQIKGDTLTFNLSGSAPEFESGDIVVGAESGGFLRRVTSVDTEGDQATLLTEQASLVDAVENGELSESFDLSGSQRKSRGQSRRGGWKAVRTEKGVEPKKNTLGIELDNVSISRSSDFEVIFTNGQANFDPAIDFGIDIGNGNIDQFRLVTSGTAEFGTDIEVAAQSSLTGGYSKSLATFRKPPIVFFIGPVPVTIQPTLDFVAGYESTVDQKGSVQTRFESSETVTLGAEYVGDSWSPVADRERSLSFDDFDWGTELTAEAKAYVRPELTFKLYQVAGPFVNTGPYVMADATSNTESWSWSLNGGLDASFGGKVEVLSFELAQYGHTFSFSETEIASGSSDRGGSETALKGEAITPSGESLSGMAVTLFGDGQDYSVTTDGSGEFLQEVEPSSYEIQGHAVKGKTYLSVNRQETTVTVEAGETASITLDTEDGYYLDLQNVMLGGEQGTVSASPGESLNLEFDYTAWSRSGLSTAAVYAAAGVEEEGQEAASLGTPGSSPGEDGSVSLEITAPSEEGTYTVYVFEAPDVSESDALSRYENNFPNEDRFIPVAELEVEAGETGNTYAPGNGYEYFVTGTEYDPDTDNIPSLVEQEFGADAELADWNTLKDLYSDDEDGLVSFLDGVGMAEDDSAYLRREGNQYWDGGRRHYFIKRHNGDVGSNFLVHDALHSNTTSLGSWYSTMPALVRLPE